VDYDRLAVGATGLARGRAAFYVSGQLKEQLGMFRLMWLFFRVGAMNELQYRVNFFIQLFQSLVALGIGLVGLALVYSHTPTLDGWVLPELLAVLGVYILMGGLIKATIQPNMQRLLDEIQQGTLDYALTKPADAQVIISVREVRIWETVDFLVGAVVIGIAVGQLHNRVGWCPRCSLPDCWCWAV
jgi:ABC-2 type transport system permease protein